MPSNSTTWNCGVTAGSPEFVRDLGWFDEHGPRATMQVTPDGDYTQSGVEWNKVGYNSPTHRQSVAAPDRSGLYYFRARTPSGARFAFPWIVAPARPVAPLAVLASNINWNAYNSFGGRSNYIHADELPPTPTVNSRFDLTRYREAEFLSWNAPSYAPLSFDRPEPFNHIDFDERITDPIEGRQACHLAPAEWRLLGWLEQRGLSYDYYAETQLDDGTLDLSAYRALVLSVHPEYWTRRMYDRVKQWVFHEGGRLLYLGGNGLNCEVESRGLVDAGPQRADHGPGRRRDRWRKPVRPPSRVGSQPPRRGLHAPRRDDRCPVPRHGRQPLDLRSHRTEGRRPVRPAVPAPALSRRCVRARDGQALAQLARRTRGCWPKG